MVKGFVYSVERVSTLARVHRTVEFGICFPERGNLAIVLRDGEVDVVMFLTSTDSLKKIREVEVPEAVVDKAVKLFVALGEFAKESDFLKELIAQ